MLYEGSCDNRKVGGQTRAVAVRVDDNVKCMRWAHGRTLRCKVWEAGWPQEWLEVLSPSTGSQEESL